MYNTIGIGNAIPGKKNCMTAADQSDDRNLGSGDLWPVISFGETCRDLWPESYRKKREESLKKQAELESRPLDYTKPMPLIWFTKD